MALDYPEDFIDRIICGDCIDVMQHIPSDSVEMILTDIPYDVVNRKSGGIRVFDKEVADILTFDLDDFVKDCVRVAKGSIYIFCSTEQVSFLRNFMVQCGLTTRLCIWEKCLVGSTYVFTKTPRGYSDITIKDLYRLDYTKNNYYLWDGNKWNKILDILKMDQPQKIIEITLRSGEKIKCTLNHQFPTINGLIEAQNLNVGDILLRTQFPETEYNIGAGFTDDIFWLIGLYLAEGSKLDETAIQLSLNIDELFIENRISKICNDYCATYSKFISGNSLSIMIYGKALVNIIRSFVLGNNAGNKRLSGKIWSIKKKLIKKVLEGYLFGDSGYDKKNDRYQLGFTKNRYLERNIRLICALLGYDKLRLRDSFNTCNEKKYPSIRGSIKISNITDHFNCKNYAEITNLEIKKPHHSSDYFDIILQNEPHLFALSTGILTHNSNPSPVNGQYMWLSGVECCVFGRKKNAVFNEHCKNTVWRFPNGKSKLHKTQKPLPLFEYLIKTSSNEGDIILDPCLGSGTTALASQNTNRRFIGIEKESQYVEISKGRLCS